MQHLICSLLIATVFVMKGKAGLTNYYHRSWQKEEGAAAVSICIIVQTENKFKIKYTSETRENTEPPLDKSSLTQRH